METAFGIRILFASGATTVMYFNSKRTQQRHFETLWKYMGLNYKHRFHTTRGLVAVSSTDIDVIGYTNACTDIDRTKLSYNKRQELARNCS